MDGARAEVEDGELAPTKAGASSTAADGALADVEDGELVPTKAGASNGAAAAGEPPQAAGTSKGGSNPPRPRRGLLPMPHPSMRRRTTDAKAPLLNMPPTPLRGRGGRRGGGATRLCEHFAQGRRTQGDARWFGHAPGSLSHPSHARDRHHAGHGSGAASGGKPPDLRGLLQPPMQHRRGHGARTTGDLKLQGADVGGDVRVQEKPVRVLPSYLRAQQRCHRTECPDPVARGTGATAKQSTEELAQRLKALQDELASVGTGGAEDAGATPSADVSKATRDHAHDMITSRTAQMQQPAGHQAEPQHAQHVHGEHVSHPGNGMPSLAPPAQLQRHTRHPSRLAQRKAPRAPPCSAAAGATMGACVIQQLPDEILARCFSFLGTRAVLLVLPLVCTRFKAVCKRALAETDKTQAAQENKEGVPAPATAARCELPTAKSRTWLSGDVSQFNVLMKVGQGTYGEVRHPPAAN